MEENFDQPVWGASDYMAYLPDKLWFGQCMERIHWVRHQRNKQSTEVTPGSTLEILNQLAKEEAQGIFRRPQEPIPRTASSRVMGAPNG